ncbi:imidazole glycerol phosphate synthase subunit HisF [Facilibium subflavum]|uniref:imidazole glycerol phosphate synthase subunit HisF n=1 Tax=Facilibium subflavum TaxID=2219058 RepID=UPI000E65A999|nr:imidazole glycerol phosphate synthase subunit HisF [Facilibium subflavum]
MLSKRIIPCLDVLNNQVVKGVKFQNHRVVGDIVELAAHYSQQGADELVFYDIDASTRQSGVSPQWVSQIAKTINIPFCVAGGIRSIKQAYAILNAGADKISINSPALERPQLINELVATFGQQCVVVGVDSNLVNNEYVVCQYTGDSKKTLQTTRSTLDWVKEIESRGAGEIVVNCMQQDGVKNGYDIMHLSAVTNSVNIPVIASGGAGVMAHFDAVFAKTSVSGALAASVFHSGYIAIPRLKQYLQAQNHIIRV